jgi:telomerase reverse transcriptase
VFEATRQPRVSDPPLEINASTSTAFKTQVSMKASAPVTLSGSARIPVQKPSLIDHATPNAMVSAFCRAVLSHLVPRDFWGTGEAQIHNENVFHRNVNRFINLRRFETLSLHEVSQDLKVRIFGPLRSFHMKLITSVYQHGMVISPELRKSKTLAIGSQQGSRDLPRVYLLYVRFSSHSTYPSKLPRDRV